MMLSERKIFVAHQYIDFRKGIDGIVAVCKQQFALDPSKGHYFVFRNRRRTALKILFYDSHGYWLCHKRLSRGQLKNWPARDLIAHELSQLQNTLLLTD